MRIKAHMTIQAKAMLTPTMIPVIDLWSMLYRPSENTGNKTRSHWVKLTDTMITVIIHLSIMDMLSGSLFFIDIVIDLPDNIDWSNNREACVHPLLYYNIWISRNLMSLQWVSTHDVGFKNNVPILNTRGRPEIFFGKRGAVNPMSVMLLTNAF